MEGSERVIVITGMAHSGTTIAAYLLAQHPDVQLVTSGEHAYLLETLALGGRDEDATPLRDALQAWPGRVLVKAPWPELNRDWLRAELPSCAVVYCEKSLAGIIESWRKPSSPAGYQGMSDEAMGALWHQQWQEASEWEPSVQTFVRISNEDLSDHPKETMGFLCAVLGLPSSDFDLALVQAKTNVKTVLKNE